MDSMSETTRIQIEKSKTYKRFNYTGSFCDINSHGDVTLDLYEDIEEYPSEIVFYDDDEPELILKPNTHTRVIHAGAMFSVQKLPELIDRLQSRLNNYIEYQQQAANGNDDDGED
jgi:hypothetical protein